MGALYTRTSDGKELRRRLSEHERESMLQAWYRPHHERLTRIVDQLLEKFDRALVVDAHSFPSIALPCDRDRTSGRPEVCIGADNFHTPLALAAAVVNSYVSAGYTVKINAPYAGALVPLAHYRSKDRRVASVMVEINRAVYMDEATGERKSDFAQTASSVQKCLLEALVDWQASAEIEA